MSFKIYADFETLLKRVQNNDRSNTSYTEKCQKHIPCSFAYKVVCVDHELLNQLFFTGEKGQSIDLLKNY